MLENLSVIITWWRYSHHTWIVLLSIYYWYRCFFLCTHLVILFWLITNQHFIYAGERRETHLLNVSYASSLCRSSDSWICCCVIVTLYEIVCLFVVILRLVYQLLHLGLPGCVFFLLNIIHKDVGRGGNFLLLCEFSTESSSIKSWRLVVWNP